MLARKTRLARQTGDDPRQSSIPQHSIGWGEWPEPADPENSAGSVPALMRAVSPNGPGAADRLLGPRCWYWPQGRDRRTLVSIVTSRLGQRLEEHGSWFLALRELCTQLAAHDLGLLWVAGTAAARFVRRAAELYGVGGVELRLPDPDWNVRDWWRTIHGFSPARPAVAGWTIACLSPIFRSERSSAPIAEAPLADRAAVALADRVFALHVRRSGHIDRLLRCRLAEAHVSPAVRILVGRQQPAGRLRDELLSAGAIGWAVFPPPGPAGRCRLTAVTAQRELDRETMRLAANAIAARITGTDWCYLTHCTRRHVGPWPNQTELTFLDDLILERPAADHSSCAALIRIVASQSLLGSSAAIRGQTRVVCFTEVPLPELAELRVFRPHRSRWDFEPYGLCVRRDVLVRLGARPVVYGTGATWAELAPCERPFFQPRGSSAESPTGIDWTREREWRIVGDVDLRCVASTEAFIFVPTETELADVQPHSVWPVIALDAVTAPGALGTSAR